MPNTMPTLIAARSRAADRPAWALARLLCAAAVLEMAGCKPCSTTLKARQQKYLETLRARPLNDPCRQMIFETDGEYRRFNGPRKVGRPRTTWLDQALATVSHS